jgi:hypothetical protein
MKRKAIVFKTFLVTKEKEKKSVYLYIYMYVCVHKEKIEDLGWPPERKSPLRNKKNARQKCLIRVMI